MTSGKLNAEYEQNGFFVVKHLFNAAELAPIREVLRDFHARWKIDNLEFFERKAVNSAYLTGTRYLSPDQRRTLFRFIASRKIAGVLNTVIPSQAAFMNTQLFFNPSSQDQKNYWHRDIQYVGSPIEQQIEALTRINVLHFRIPMTPEPGLELVPGSHKNWDTPEELDVRLEQNGKKNFDALSTGQKVPLEVGDLLVFSANMIHRGLYGMDRFSFDLLFCDAIPELLAYADSDCLPDANELETLECPDCFANSIHAKSD